MSMDGKFETSVSLNPQKSQIFTTGCLVLSGVCLIASFAFLWADKDGWLVPLIGGAISGGVGLLCWLLSHRNSDLSGGRPTQLIADDKGVNLTFDPRNQPTKQMLRIFAAHAESIAYRERLPPSSGLIDAFGKVIDNSEKEANFQIDKLNIAVADQFDKLNCLVEDLQENGAPFKTSEVSAPVYTGEEPVKSVALKGSS